MRTQTDLLHWLGNVLQDHYYPGVNNRTVSCVPTALCRLYCLLTVSSISNLRAILSLK